MTLTPATIITLARIDLLIVLILLHIFAPEWVWLSFSIFALAAISDFIDGWVARKFNQCSEFGAMLDQICDKILVIAVFLLLAARGTLADWGLLAATLIIIREFLVAGLRDYLGNQNIAVPVSKLGKWKTTFQMIALTLLMAVPLMAEFSSTLQIAGDIALWTSAILGLMSAWGYMPKRS